MSAAAAGLLARQLKQMKSDKDIPGISCGLVDESNVFAWEVMLMISDDDKHYGGKGRISNMVLQHLTRIKAVSFEQHSHSHLNTHTCHRR